MIVNFDSANSFFYFWFDITCIFFPGKIKPGINDAFAIRLKNNCKKFYKHFTYNNLQIRRNLSRNDQKYFEVLKKKIVAMMQQSYPGINPSISEWKGQDITDFQEELLRSVNAPISEK